MFFYSIMKLFITLLENVNKSRTSAGNLSFTDSEHLYIIGFGRQDSSALAEV
jgi:hypothetical protein